MKKSIYRKIDKISRVEITDSLSLNQFVIWNWNLDAKAIFK